VAIFKQGDNSCYFIHIPRTGGRYVSSLFEKSQNVESQYHKINEQRIDNIDVTHLHYPLYEYYFGVESIPHIAVVRNPYDKFLSSIRNMYSIHGTDYNEVIQSQDSFLKFINIEIEIQSFHNNWFLPQYKFISPKTYFWKYEWGFGEKFKKWVKDKTQIELTNDDVEYEKFDGETKNTYELDKKVKKYVKDFYKNDYKKFGYFS